MLSPAKSSRPYCFYKPCEGIDFMRILTDSERAKRRKIVPGCTKVHKEGMDVGEQRLIQGR